MHKPRETAAILNDYFHTLVTTSNKSIPLFELLDSWGDVQRFVLIGLDNALT